MPETTLTDESPSQRDASTAAIEHLYDVAIDPTSYERMLDFWEDMVRRPAREKSEAVGAIVNTAMADISKHLERADKVLGQTLMAPPDETAQTAVANIRHAATSAINAAARLISVNAAATQSLGVTAGARVSDLPFEDGEVERLAQETIRMLRGNVAANAVVCLRARSTERLVIAHLRLFRPLTAEAFVLCITSEIS